MRKREEISFAEKEKIKDIVVEMETEEESSCFPKKNAGFVRFLPSTVTICAFCFGLTSIRFALFQRWELAVICIFVSALLDSLDGKVARLIGQTSHFGAELDSLSDLVCFGVAPAILLFWRSTYLLGGAGWGICMFFTACCALRLARFNVGLIQSIQKKEWEKKYFEGVPAPLGAILALFPMILFFQTKNEIFLRPSFVSVYLISSGILMISTIRTFSSKMIAINNKSAPMALLIIASFVIFLITEVWLTLITLIIAYLIFIPFGGYEYSKLKNAEGVVENEVCEEITGKSAEDK